MHLGQWTHTNRNVRSFTINFCSQPLAVRVEIQVHVVRKIVKTGREVGTHGRAHARFAQATGSAGSPPINPIHPRLHLPVAVLQSGMGWEDRTPDEWLKIGVIALVVVGAAAIALIAWGLLR